MNEAETRAEHIDPALRRRESNSGRKSLLMNACVFHV